jgi:hypothetical protein
LAYLKKERKLKPLFVCVDEPTEQIMARDFDWRSLAVAAEERIDPTAHNPNSQTTRSNLGKKITQAKNNGVKAVVCDELPDEKIRKEIDQRMEVSTLKNACLVYIELSWSSIHRNGEVREKANRCILRVCCHGTIANTDDISMLLTSKER